jgi:hypothetical protein
MLPTQFLLPPSRSSSIAAVDEARPRGRNKRFSVVRRDTKPRLFVPTTTSKRKASSRFKSALVPPASADMNALLWMQSTACPTDVLPKILAYAGPQMAQTLSHTNTFWDSVLNEEATWRTMCEELYKVRSIDVVDILTYSILLHLVSMKGHYHDARFLLLLRAADHRNNWFRHVFSCDSGHEMLQ